jgi:hypothetical protein
MKRFATTLLCIIAATAAGAENLLQNSSFEYGTRPDNWGRTWGTFALESWNKPPDGIYAAYLRGSWCGTNFGGFMQSVTTVVPGITYRLKGLFFVDNAWTAKKKALKLEFFNDSGSMLLSATNDLLGLRSNAWVERSVEATAPPRTARAQVIIEAIEIAGNGVLGVDVVELEAVDPKPRQDQTTSASP